MTLRERWEQWLGPAGYSTGEEDRWVHAGDGSRRQGLCAAVLWPREASVVAQLMKMADESAVPVVVRGAGSGLTGGAVPLRPDTWVIDLSRMDRVLEIDESNLVARVQPGVVVAKFQQEVESRGLFYPPDPASNEFATMGGNVAENAGGLRGLKYGVTRDYVLALEAVTARGEILHFGARTLKSVTGFDLTRLLVGSEGLLAVITEITVKLIPLPETIATRLAYFSSPVPAGKAASRMIRERIVPRALEFMDGEALAAVRSYGGYPVPEHAGALLLVELDGPREAVERDGAKAEKILREEGAGELLTGTGPARDNLWAVRRAISAALCSVSPAKVSEDICVPRSRFAETLAGLQAIAREERVKNVNFGHAGDGNLHVNLLYDPADPGMAERVERAIGRIFRLALDLGGTLSGEHGIGITKAAYLGWEIPPAEMALMKGIKRLWDPRGLLNPGKIFPPEGGKT